VKPVHIVKQPVTKVNMCSIIWLFKFIKICYCVRVTFIFRFVVVNAEPRKVSLLANVLRFVRTGLRLCVNVLHFLVSKHFFGFCSCQIEPVMCHFLLTVL
jgi:predicted phosphatase